LVNEPLKAFQAFVEPADLSPDLLSLGTKKVVMFHIANELGEIAKNVSINNNEISFDIPENYLFEKYSGEPGAQFVSVMEKIKILTMGLEEAKITIDSAVMAQGYPTEKRGEAENIAGARLDLVKTQVASAFEHQTNDLKGDAFVSQKPVEIGASTGFIRIQIKPKESLPEGFKHREIRGELGKSKGDLSVYDNFVDRMSESKKKNQKKKK
jgi:chemotaxis protein MotB